jgi:hypothetical protein
MTAAELIHAIEREGGCIRYRPPGGLAVELPSAQRDGWVPLLREFKPEILALLGPLPPAGPCPAGHPAYWWRLAEDGPWHCGRCEPDPRAALWAGATLADLGGRCLVLAAPAGLPAIREWVKVPAGWATLLGYSAGGAECFVRLFNPQPGQRPLQWVPTARVIPETAAQATNSGSPAQPQQRGPQ